MSSREECPSIISGRSLISCNRGERFGVWFSIVHTPRGVRITIGRGGDGEGMSVESCEPETIRFIASLIHQLRAVAA